MKKQSIQNIALIFIIGGLIIATRLVPHLNNFTPFSAIILFCSVFVKNKYLKFGIPFLLILLSDLFIHFKTGQGFHSGTPTVYLAYVLVFCVGLLILKTVNVINVIFSAFSSAVVFFLVTNFAFFYPEAIVSNPALGHYSHDLSGIISSYIAGIPFFRNMIFGDLLFTSILFGSYSLLVYKKLKTKKIKNKN